MRGGCSWPWPGRAWRPTRGWMSCSAGLDGVPLAVELMAYAAQGQPDLAEVAQRWRAERTGMLARMGGARRELSVAVSVEASVTSPLMTGAGRGGC